jgi:hypothetical protein
MNVFRRLLTALPEKKFKSLSGYDSRIDCYFRPTLCRLFLTDNNNGVEYGSLLSHLFLKSFNKVVSYRCWDLCADT